MPTETKEELLPVLLERPVIENMLYGGGKPGDHRALTAAFLAALNASEHGVGDNPYQEEED